MNNQCKDNTAKLRRAWLLPFFLLLTTGLYAQSKEKYRLQVQAADSATATVLPALNIPNEFDTRNECVAWVNKLPALLQSYGYATASLDSVLFDTTHARLVVYTGDKYTWAQLDTRQTDRQVLQAIGWRQSSFDGKPMDFTELRNWQDKIISYLENNGYPFAKVWLDSVQVETPEQVRGRLYLEKGPEYHVDSIRVNGTAKISNDFLQRYLELSNGSLFNKEKLLRVSRRIKELTYVEEENPPRIIWLNSGSVLELFLKQKRSSQVNVLVGFLPNNDQLSSKKILITGEANLNLKNALGMGETIGLNWQQLQVRSPRLNIIYQHPYLLNSPVGLDFSFDMFRKDSTFLNINFQLGGQYVVNAQQSGRLFIQRFQSIVNGVNKNFILQQYRLPDAADMGTTNLGLDYEVNTTNYRLNPTRGNELRVVTTAGIKKLKKNNEVLELKDPANPSFDFGTLYDTIKLKTYQFRVRVTAAHYFPLGAQNRTTIKAGLQAGFLQSGNIFRNELFQIGGYKLLRGFDEESQYLSQFAVGTAEFRYLIGQNSYFYGFTDGGWGRNNSQNTRVSYTYLGVGMGLAFESKVGIFNLAWAIGKQSDLEFNLRQSKIHFGFVNYF